MTHIRLWIMILIAVGRSLTKKFLGNSPAQNPPLHSDIGFLATPFDIDLNFHVNNSVYLRFMDLGRWHYALKTGSMRRMIKQRWFPVGARVEIQYRKPIPLMRRFSLSTRIVELRDRRIIFEQVFYRKADRAIFARATVQVCLLKNGKTIDVTGFEPFIQTPFK